MVREEKDAIRASNDPSEAHPVELTPEAQIVAQPEEEPAEEPTGDAEPAEETTEAEPTEEPELEEQV